jgi:hypothetical protein
MYDTRDDKMYELPDKLVARWDRAWKAVQKHAKDSGMVIGSQPLEQLTNQILVREMRAVDQECNDAMDFIKARHAAQKTL